MWFTVIMLNDVARAFFEAPAMRNICIEIPKEDVSEADKRHDKVSHLRMSLYGTRDAAMNWQEEVAKEMAATAALSLATTVPALALRLFWAAYRTAYPAGGARKPSVMTRHHLKRIKLQ